MNEIARLKRNADTITDHVRAGSSFHSPNHESVVSGSYLGNLQIIVCTCPQIVCRFGRWYSVVRS